MKKLICALVVIISAATVVGCDDKKDNVQAFAGHWKAISKADGRDLHPKSSSVMDITCSEAACHIVSKNKSVLSDDELVSNTDWNIKDETTLMRGNGMSSIYVKENKLITSNFIYEKQTE